MSQRINQGVILQTLRTLQPVIAAVHDARVRYQECADLRPKRLSGLSRFLKEMAALPQDSDYTTLEGQLKRRLIRAQRRLFGYQRHGDGPVYALARDLPMVYQTEVGTFNAQLNLMLRRLADVDVVTRREPLQTVRALRATPPLQAAMVAMRQPA